MKALRFLLALVFLLPLHALRAEIDQRELMSVDVPFAFTVGNTHLPAGHYVIYAVHLEHLWEISSFRRGGSAFFSVVMDRIQAGPGGARLIFNRYDSEYVLRRIDNSSERTTAMLHVTKREKQLARGHAQPEIAMVYVATWAATGARRE